MDRENLRRKFRGALLGVAVGDALGAPFEGASGADLETIEDLVESRGPLSYTDDTAMTIGVATSLIECDGFDGAHMASVFARDYAAEPWRGYGPTPPRIFALLQKGVPYDEAARRVFGGEGSFGNGGAMRVAPAGLWEFRDLDRVKLLSERTAVITHSHPLGVEGAVLQGTAIALLVHLDAASSLEPGDLLEELRMRVTQGVYAEALDRVGGLLPEAPKDRVIADLGHGIESHRSVPTALYCFLRSPTSFRDAVAYAISLGGDTDTIASMTGALAGAALGEMAIPPEWVAAVEGTERMRETADEMLVRVDGS